MTRLKYVYTAYVPKESRYIFRPDRRYRVFAEPSNRLYDVECELPGEICSVVVENDAGRTCAYLNYKMAWKVAYESRIRMLLRVLCERLKI